ncbi:bolA-like protein DDB_G0274169 isoform X5 [Homalodisca vitripennis]|uniref:bolA-like protein DDB_G0274169 isoform X5 n=1 Tax=Homalodisca vitripennis TaxID=197043 RepID=UPI001EEB1118|nr:bolA-like protein DDB_G0274169 isoform X5 [Homalodisca vitripennis]
MITHGLRKIMRFLFLASKQTMSRVPFSGGPVEMGIRKKITEKLNPLHLEVINESYKHNAPPGTEAHFKVIVVAEQFKDMPLIKRHRTVNEVLSTELATTVHALSIEAKTPEQWAAKPEAASTPACLGGFGK